MSDNCKYFIEEIQKQYIKYPSELDDNCNMTIFITPVQSIIVSYKVLKPYYDGYRRSSMSRSTAIGKALLKIDELVNKY